MSALIGRERASKDVFTFIEGYHVFLTWKRCPEEGEDGALTPCFCFT